MNVLKHSSQISWSCLSHSGCGTKHVRKATLDPWATVLLPQPTQWGRDEPSLQILLKFLNDGILKNKKILFRPLYLLCFFTWITITETSVVEESSLKKLFVTVQAVFRKTTKRGICSGAGNNREPLSLALKRQEQGESSQVKETSCMERTAKQHIWHLGEAERKPGGCIPVSFTSCLLSPGNAP